MDIVVRGRNVEVPEHYRRHVTDKLQRVERYDHKVIRIDVELYHEKNRRQSNSCQRVEITCKSRGPVIRSEACAHDFYAALDNAVTKLENRLRRGADRRRVHHGMRTPTSVAAATGTTSGDIQPEDGDPDRGALRTALLDRPSQREADAEDDGARSSGDTVIGSDTHRESDMDHDEPGLIVREKEHPAKPMSLDQALFEMELVGHDFYLFRDVDTGKPSVVYRRKGYDYGVIRLAG